MLQIAAEIVLDREVALVDRRHPGKRVHVVENLAVLVMNDGAFGVAVRKALDVAPGHAVGDFLDGEIEFIAGDEIDRASRDEALFGLDRDLGADEADFDVRIDRLDHLRRLHVRFERRRRGVHHDEVAVLQLRHDVLEAQAVRRRIDQLRAFDERGRLRQPGRIPERAHLALHLIAGAGAAVVAVE